MATAGLTISQYARHRRERGLPGETAAAVRKALASGRITTESDGRINAASADRQWILNTDPMRQRLGSDARPGAAGPIGHGKIAAPDSARSGGFAEAFAAGRKAGATWLAGQLVSSARRAWPTFVSGLSLGSEEELLRPLLVTVLLHLLEGWAANYLIAAQLPEIDWSPFGDRAEEIAHDAALLRAEWTGEIPAEVVA